MALSKESLRNRIISELRAQGFNVDRRGRDDIDWLVRWSTALANAIIDEIHQNARVKGRDSDGDWHDLPVE